nr:AI-2E family transporter [Chloroflexota bacterium]
MARGTRIMEVTLSPRARIVVAWAAVIFGGFILIESAHALRPFIWAIITAYIFHPLVSMIHRKTRLPKHVITTWLYLLIGLVLTLVLINLTPLIVSQITDLQVQLPNAIEETRRWLDQRTRLGRYNLEPGFLRQRVDQFTAELADTLSAAALPIVLTTFTVAIELLIYMIASFYFIVYGDKFMITIRDIFNRRYHYEFDRLMRDINATLGAYIRGQLVLVLIMSTASFIALTILNVDYALSLAIATGFLELIPLIGPWTAGTIAVLITLFQDTTPFGWSNLTLALVVGLTYFALRQLEDSFIIPLVIGRIVHLHPLLV